MKVQDLKEWNISKQNSNWYKTCFHQSAALNTTSHLAWKNASGQTIQQLSNNYVVVSKMVSSH